MDSGAPDCRVANNTTNQLDYIKGLVIPALFKEQYSWPFRKPVDYVKLKLTDYLDVIKTPMDLGTMKARLNSKFYQFASECLEDLFKMFTNCYIYNRPGDDIVVMAQHLESVARQHLQQMLSCPKVEIPVLQPVIMRVGQTNLSTETDASKSAVDSAQELDGAALFCQSTPIVPAVSTHHDGPSRSTMMQNPTTRKHESTSIDGTQAASSSRDYGRGLRRPKEENRDVNLSDSLTQCWNLLTYISSANLRHLNTLFLEPVDVVGLGLHDYYDIISHPMDLSTVRSKLERGVYYNKAQFANDIRLMFDNCYQYNGEGSKVARIGRRLQAIFEKIFAKINGCVNDYDCAQTVQTARVVPLLHAVQKDHKKIDADFKRFEKELQSINTTIHNILTFLKQSSANAIQKDSLRANLLREAHQNRKKTPGRPKGHPFHKISTDPQASPGASRVPKSIWKCTPEVTVAPVTFDERKKLCNDIKKLPEKYLLTVVKIIQQTEKTQCDREADQVELDFENMQDSTVRALQRYVKSVFPGGKSSGKGATIRSSERPSVKSRTRSTRRISKRHQASTSVAGTPNCAANHETRGTFSSDVDIRALTLEERTQIFRQFTQLSGEHQGRFIQIIRQHEHLNCDNMSDEIEVGFGTLQDSTLRALECCIRSLLQTTNESGKSFGDSTRKKMGKLVIRRQRIKNSSNRLSSSSISSSSESSSESSNSESSNFTPKKQQASSSAMPTGAATTAEDLRGDGSCDSETQDTGRLRRPAWDSKQPITNFHSQGGDASNSAVPLATFGTSQRGVFDKIAAAQQILREVQRQQEWSLKVANDRAARARDLAERRQREADTAIENRFRDEMEFRLAEEHRKRTLEARVEADRLKRMATPPLPERINTHELLSNFENEIDLTLIDRCFPESP